MNMYSSQSYCISFFYLQIKPFYMDVFYLHSLWSYLHKLWSYLQRLAEIEQTGKNPLTIQQEMFRDADKIF